MKVKTELEFVNRILVPYFHSQNEFGHFQAIQIKKSGGGHGFDNIEHFKNTISPLKSKLSFNNNIIITTLLDYYGINSDKKVPNYSTHIKLNNVDKIIDSLEFELKKVVEEICPNNNFIPYIQKHEIETFLFANPIASFKFENNKIGLAIQEIKNQYTDIEDINSSLHTAPSKRISKVFEENNSKYNKASDAVEMMELAGIDSILNQCTRFKKWIDLLSSKMKQ